MIVAFTRERILSPTEIFSKEGTHSNFHGYRVRNYNINVANIIMSNDQIRALNDNWGDIWIKPYVWAKVANTRFQKYFKEVVVGNTYLEAILGSSLWK